MTLDNLRLLGQLTAITAVGSGDWLGSMFCKSTRIKNDYANRRNDAMCKHDRSSAFGQSVCEPCSAHHDAINKKLSEHQSPSNQTDVAAEQLNRKKRIRKGDGERQVTTMTDAC